MAKQSRCPGCKQTFVNGRPHSIHMASCIDLRSATDTALKKHKINTARKLRLKKLDLEARKELGLVATNQLEVASYNQDVDEDFNFNDVAPAQNSPSPPPTRPSGRPNRQIRLPLRYRDDLPPNPNPPIVPIFEVLDVHEEPLVQSPSEDFEPISLSELTSALFCTETNSFGIYRKYTLGPPTITPDETFTLSSLSDSISIARDPADSQSNSSWWSSFTSSTLETTTLQDPKVYFAPFLNPSTFLLMSWYYNGSSIKSYADVDKLIHNVIRQDDFKSSDFAANFSTAREAERMDKNDERSTKSHNTEYLPFKPEDGWIKASVSIALPCDGVKFKSEEDAPRFVVDEIWYRRPLEVLKLAFSELAAEKFHFTPFEEYWKPSNDQPEERIYSETFTADIFNEEYETLRTTSREGPNAQLEPFIAGIQFYSDATHLANFGTASLYPMYMYLGNQSQYLRAKPSEFTAHHIAYIPKVFNDLIFSIFIF